MSDTDKLRNEMSRGIRAQQVLENDLVKEALSTIRESILSSWELSKANDKEGREEAWKMLKVVNEFERHLRTVMDTGKMATFELSRLEKFQDKVSNLFK